MKVVIDTNIIVSDFMMRSPSFEVLLENCKNGTIQVFVPQVVIDEALNKFKLGLESIKAKTDREIKVLRRLTGKVSESLLTEEEINIEINKYNEYVNQIFANHNVVVLPYPKTPHKKIAIKAIEKKKPFDSNGSGYRDTLIWENIKELLTKDHEILVLPELIFITNNISDFGTDQNLIHPDLCEEMERDLLNPESIKLFPSLQEYIDKEAKINLEQEHRIELSIKNDEFESFNLKSTTSKFLIENFVGREIDKEEIAIPYEFENPTVQSINEDYKIEDISVKKLSQSKFLIDVTFDLEVHLDFFIYKMDYWGMNEDIRPSVIDNDWNDHYMWAEKDWSFKIFMSLLINPEMEVLSCEINKINSTYSPYYD